MSYISVSHAVTNACTYFKFHWNVVYTCLQLPIQNFFQFHCSINIFLATTMQVRQNLHCFLQHMSTFKCKKQAWSGAVCIYAYVKNCPRKLPLKWGIKHFIMSSNNEIIEFYLQCPQKQCLLQSAKKKLTLIYFHFLKCLSDKCIRAAMLVDEFSMFPDMCIKFLYYQTTTSVS